MGIDDLIRIVLILAFFVVPILRGLAGARRQQRGQRPGTGIPKQPRQTRGIPTPTEQERRDARMEDTRTNNRSAERSTTTVSRVPQASGGSGDFSKRLEEARRRVREAVETQTTTGQTGGQRASTRQTNAGRTASQPVAVPKAPTPKPAAREANELFGPRENVKETVIKAGDSAYANRSPSAFLPSESVTATSSFSKGLATESQPLQVQRRRAKKYAKLEASPLLKLDEKSIMSGFIWHQILSEPRAKQRRRIKS